MRSLLTKLRSSGLVRQMHLFPLLTVSLGHLIVDMYMGGFPVLFPRLQEAFALTYTQIGLLIFLSQFSSSVLQPLFGLLSDKVRSSSVLPIGLALAALGLVLIVYAPNYTVVLLGTTICGLGVAAYHPESSRLAMYAGQDRQSTAMSAFAVSGNIGLALGPALMTFGLATVAGGSGAAINGALIYVPITLIVIGMVYFGREQLYAIVPDRPPTIPSSRDKGDVTEQLLNEKDLPEAGRPVSIWRIGQWPTPYRWMATLLIYIFIRSTAHTGMQTIIPLYYQGKLRMTDVFSGSLLSAFLIGGAVGTIVGGLLADIVGTRTVAITSFVISPILIAAVPYTGTGPISLALMFVAGMILILSFSLTTVLGQRFLPANMGLAAGLTLGFSVGAGGVGAALLGVIADAWGLESSFWAMAILLVVGLGCAFALPKDRTVDSYFKDVATKA